VGLCIVCLYAFGFLFHFFVFESDGNGLYGWFMAFLASCHELLNITSRTVCMFMGEKSYVSIRDPLVASSSRSVDGDLDCLLARTACELGSDGVSAAMESLSTSETVSAASPMDMDLAGSSTATDKQSHLIPVIRWFRSQFSVN